MPHKVLVNLADLSRELEGKNLRFVKEHFNIPVPDVYAAFTDLNDGMKYVVMEFIEGETLDAIWPGLSPAERANVINQIKSYLLELRKLPSHGYIGCIDGTRNWGPLFGFPRKSLKPFASEQEMGESVMQTIAGVRKITGEPARSESFLRIIRSTIMPTFQGHEIYFTHGDLQPRNIIVTRKSDVPNDLTVTIIDWESASWAPEYREYTIAMTTPEMKSMWTEVVAEAFQEYRVEYLTMQYVSRFGRVFY
ncbi:hypothetical protein ANO11243_085330 [Dothideomycetidae sp. 11243]|nr:hypothetical protein ANO11243_085330 [fungal sp. No.11243]